MNKALATRLGAYSDASFTKPEMRARRFRARGTKLHNRHWVRNDPIATAFFNALSIVFPYGERFMIESMRPWQSHANEPLAAEIAAFIEQEAGHSREHFVMNKALTECGYAIAPLEKAIRNILSFCANRGKLTKLGVTMCIEHFTAIIAAELLKNPGHLQDSNPELHKLWLWHSVEEIEHKAVAFDTWMMATAHWSELRRWLTRSLLCTGITISCLINRTRGQMELLRQDGVTGHSALLKLLRFGFAKGGIGRAVFRPWLTFLRPGFHPWQIDDRHLIIKGENLLAALQLATEGEVKTGLTGSYSGSKPALAA
jgi:uncharacterized protein